MKILLLGKDGQVGSALQQALSPIGELLALNRTGYGEFCGDLTDLVGLRKTVVNFKPDIIVNAAAYTAVDKAEEEPALAQEINSQAVAVLADCAAQIDSWLIHYSTDYVFDGEGCLPWQEVDTPRPLNIYGQTKLDGEQAIVASGCKYLILRTSWVYSAYGNNFLNTILRLAHEREQLQVVNDQIGAPTSAELLAHCTVEVIRQLQNMPVTIGTYNVSALGQVSWYGFACYVIEEARRLGATFMVRDIVPIPSSEYVQTARRPLNSRLNCTKIQETFGLTLPHWQVDVSRLLAERWDVKR